MPRLLTVNPSTAGGDEDDAFGFCKGRKFVGNRHAASAADVYISRTCIIQLHLDEVY